MFGAPKAPPPPATRAPQPVADGPAPESARGRSVALLGLPSSGKTSYLYALTHTSARGRHRWVIGLHTKEFERLTGDANERQEGTPVGEFRPARLFGMSRPWLGALGMRRGPGHARDLVIPEIAGETVERYALGRELKDAERAAVGKLKDYLHHSDEVLFLVGIDGTQGAAGGRLRPESVEASMLGAVKALRTILKDMQDGRDRGEPIFVSLLVTKRDRLRGTPMDRVRLRSAESSLARLARRPGRRWLASEGLVSDGGEEVTFSVNDVCGHLRARHDLDVQEAAAADFLRCHAPRAAADLAELAAQPGISLRLLAIAPYGTPSLDASGAAVFPQLTKITPSLVFESLEDLVERRFRRHARTRIAWATSALAAVLVMALALGPVWTWHFRSKAADAVNRQAWQEAATALRQAGVMPWWRVEVAVRNRATEDAELIGRVLAGLSSSGVRAEPGLDQDSLLGMFATVAPDKVEAIGQQVARNNAEDVAKYLQGQVESLPTDLRLDPDSVGTLDGLLDQFFRRREIVRKDVESFKACCEQLQKAMSEGRVRFVDTGGSDAPKKRLGWALERAIERAKLEDLWSKKPAEIKAVNAAKVHRLDRMMPPGASSPGGDIELNLDEVSGLLRPQAKILLSIADQQSAGSALERLAGTLRKLANRSEGSGPDSELSNKLKDLKALAEANETKWAFGDGSAKRLHSMLNREEAVTTAESLVNGAQQNGGINSPDALKTLKDRIEESDGWKQLECTGGAGGNNDAMKVEILGRDGEWTPLVFEAFGCNQRKRLGNAMNAINDWIAGSKIVDRDQLKKNSREILRATGLKDSLEELEDLLANEGVEAEVVKDSFKSACEQDRHRMRVQLVSKAREALRKRIGRFAIENPDVSLEMLDELAPTSELSGDGCAEAQAAIEAVLGSINDAGDTEGAGEAAKKLARAGLKNCGFDQSERRRNWFKDRIDKRLEELVKGGGLRAVPEIQLRMVIALDAARVSVGGNNPGGAEALPGELVERLVKAFTSPEGVLGTGNEWIDCLVGLKDIKDWDQVKAVNEHRELIRKHDLKPVSDGQAVVVYLGKQPFTPADLNILGDSSKSLCCKYVLKLDREGVMKEIPNGLRLPTLKERQLIDNPEVMSSFVGLGDREGVFEWVSDHEKPHKQGTACSGRREPESEDDADYLADVGARPALDPIPQGLRRGLDAPRQGVSR